MNFDFSEEQKLLADSARKFLGERCGTDVVRQILDGDEPFDRNVWKGLVELEWPGTAVPESYGGVGFGHLELCVTAQEIGRALAPVPFSSSVYLATEAILLAGTEGQRETYLRRLVTGETIGTLALSEASRTPTPNTLSVEFREGKLYGLKTPVPDGDVADFAVVVATTPGGATEESTSLVLVDLNAGGVSRERVSTIDPTRSHARVVFDGAAAERLGPGGAGWPLLERLFDRAAVLQAFEQLGGADACLEMAQEYAKTRYAFGRPIGSFQAIKHKLADAFVKNELARSNCLYAAWALSAGAPELPVAAAAARISATEAFQYIAAENIQTHGGIGFTWESDCQLFYRRSKLLSLSLGSSRRWKDRLVTQLLLRQKAVGDEPGGAESSVEISSVARA